MGALHEGHLSLIRSAKQGCDAVVTSIFVNPAQFGPHEDFDGYPRDEKGDLESAETEGVDVVFIPPVDEMYPEGAVTRVHVGELATIVEGAARTGHFDGVATVVARLFNLVGPDAALFGQKDAQQVAVVRRMTADLGFPIDVRSCPTVREDDGLALSTRNAYLSPAERATAPGLYRALTAATKRAGEDPRGAEAIMLESLHEAGIADVDYALAVDPHDFHPAEPGSKALLVVAARIGSTRLIDNLPVNGWR